MAAPLLDHEPKNSQILLQKNSHLLQIETKQTGESHSALLHCFVAGAAEVTGAVKALNHAIEDSLIRVADQVTKDQDKMMRTVMENAAVPRRVAEMSQQLGAVPMPENPQIRMHSMETNIPLIMAIGAMLLGFLYIICMLKAMAGKLDMDVESIKHNKPANQLQITIPTGKGPGKLNPNFCTEGMQPVVPAETTLEPEPEYEQEMAPPPPQKKKSRRPRREQLSDNLTDDSMVIE